MTKDTRGIVILFTGVIMTTLFGIMPPIVLGGLIGGFFGVVTALLGGVLGTITGVAITREIYEMEVTDEG